MQARWNSWKQSIGRYRNVASLRKPIIIVAGASLLIAASLLVTVPSRPSLFGNRRTTGISSTVSASVASAAGAALDGPAAAGQSAASSGASESSQTASAAPQGTYAAAGGRLVIETADVLLTVSNVAGTGSKVSGLTKESGGFIQSMNESMNSQSQEVETITIRVPESQFQSVLTALKSYGKIDSFSQTGQDVTSQSNNLQQQLSELEQEAAAYSRLFDKATTMADMLQIQQSLTQVNGQISNLNEELHQLDKQVQYATINMTLQAAEVSAHAKEKPLWSLPMQSLRLMGRVGIGFAKIAAWMLPWALLAGLSFGGVRVCKKGRAKKGG